ncbi:MAG: hypothetical protein K2K53_10935, partial [Oscillospiraceae bacterium]|nr:hypothetical protein [Oscillospiraceae bacterium]
GTVQAGGCAVEVSNKGTVTLAGGAFSTVNENAASVRAQGVAVLNVTGPDVEIDRLSAGNGTQVSLTAGTYNKIVTGHLITLSSLLVKGCAYYRNGSPIALEELPKYDADSYKATLTGPVTVGVCTHPGLKATPDEGGGTHSGKCAYCSYAVEKVDCAYGEYQHDENSHWKTCKVCGYENKEAHIWTLACDPNKNGSGMLNYDYCIRCDREQGHFTVTVNVPDGLIYGQTGGIAPTCTVEPEKEYDHLIWQLADSEGEPLHMEHNPEMGRDTLPADLPAGDYQLFVEGRTLTGELVFSGYAEFTVAPAQLTDVFTLSETEFTYDKTEHKPTVTAEGLTGNTDYTVSYSDNVNAGEATVTVTGKGNYTGTVEKKFTINKAVPNIPTLNVLLFYGQKLSDITLPTGGGIPDGAWTWADPNAQPKASGEMYSAAFTPDDTANYKSVPEVAVEVNVRADAPEITVNVPDRQQVGKAVEIGYT